MYERERERKIEREERERDCNLEARWRQTPKRLKKTAGIILVKQPEVKLCEITCKAYGIL